MPVTALAGRSSSTTLRLRFAAAALLFLCASVPAGAASLGVAPTMLEFGPGDVARGLSLRNTGNAPLQAQVRVFAWTQQGGEDVLEPSTALVASPPFLTIAPGAQQFVRIIHRSGQPAAGDGGERSFRILVDELPPAALSPEAAAQHGRDASRPALNFVVRYSIPVFIAPASARTAPDLHWELQQTGGVWQLVAENRGGRRAQIVDVELIDDGGRRLFRHDGLAGYALAGAVRRWSFVLPEGAPAATVIGVRVNGQPLRQPLAPASAAD